ncbi:MAG TPA: GNAT family N-acetyltransferase [Candidatus Brocadiia bacterium]|nr:GNAT family N-acetyltransferase [Candidatus Brocadiia bacterium]
MENFDWKEKFADQIGTAAEAMKLIKPGFSVFIGTGCAQPQHLVKALVAHSARIYDCHIIHLLTMGTAPYADPQFREQFKMNSFFVADNVRHALDQGIGDYSPIFLSEIPAEFSSGRIPIDIALITVTPPDRSGLCSLGVSVDIVKSAAANARFVVAQVNSMMPRTGGDSFIHVNNIDMLVPCDEPVIEVPVNVPDETLQRIGQNIGRLVEDGSTIECGIGRIPQALADYLRDKKDLGVHTEMFGDWIIDLIECGAITCTKKTINNGKVVASFCMGSKRLYDFIDNNSFFDFRPTEYVNDPFIISRHDKMVAINVGLEIDLSGQVCSDSLGYRFYSGIGGQVDFVRGAARSRGGKAIIAMPSTARNGEVSRIVPHLTEGAGVVTTRGDVHYVVTEFGIAYLHGKSISKRVLALINIAHPKFRNWLIEAAKKQRYIPEDQIQLAWDSVRYPEEFERYDTLKDGMQIFFRPVRPPDEPALSEMLYSLSSSSVHTRYFTHSMTFPHKAVQQLTNIDYHNDMAIVGIVPAPGGDQVVALAQYFLDPQYQMAEVAFIVQDEWQQKGMGQLLMDYLATVARKRGVKKFFAKVLPVNKAMLSVFQNSGYPVNISFDGDAYSIYINLEAEDSRRQQTPGGGI